MRSCSDRTSFEQRGRHEHRSRDPGRRARYENGTDPRYRGPRPCIQSSDAHAPEEVGRRPTFFRMETISLPALRAALAEYRTAVRFPGEEEAGG